MSHSHDFQTSPSQQSIKILGQQLEQLRLSKNLNQSVVASEAGVSRRTITRMESGETVSLDTFIRVLKVYDIADRLTSLFPAHTVRPIERVEFDGKQRKRASSIKNSQVNKSTQQSEQPWSWNDNADQGNEKNND